MKDNLGSQGRTQGGTPGKNIGTHDGQTGFDSMDEQGIGTEGQDITRDDPVDQRTPVEEVVDELDKHAHA